MIQPAPEPLATSPEKPISKHKMKQLRGRHLPSSSQTNTSNAHILRDDSPLTELSSAPSPVPGIDASGSSSTQSSMEPVTPPENSLDQSLSQFTGVTSDGSSGGRRSPKRKFSDSDLSADGEGDQDGSVNGQRKRRNSSAQPLPTNLDEEEERSIVRLLQYDSQASSPAPVEPKSSSPPPRTPNKKTKASLKKQPILDLENQENDKPLSRRKRRALGLPKHGNGGTATVAVRASGRASPARRQQTQTRSQSQAQSQSTATPAPAPGQAEWEKNGSGRMDSRGFRELRI